MSHTTTVSEVRVHSKAALSAAVDMLRSRNGLKISMKDNAACRLWGSNTVHCEHVVAIDGCRFDVGFQKAKDGIGLVPVFDSHGGELAVHIGQGAAQAKTPAEHALSNIGKLMQEYAFQAIWMEALMQGATVNHMTNDAGQYVLTVSN